MSESVPVSFHRHIKFLNRELSHIIWDFLDNFLIKLQIIFMSLAKFFEFMNSYFGMTFALRKQTFGGIF